MADTAAAQGRKIERIQRDNVVKMPIATVIFPSHRPIKLRFDMPAKMFPSAAKQFVG